MDTVLITARVGLAAVFVIAAMAKLLDLPGSRRALEGFGIPRRLVSPGAIALPLTELTAAGLLVPVSTARAGAILAVVLLAAFVGGIVAALRRGATPECHCFGQLHSRPAGGATITRNAALAAIALFVAIAGPGPSLGGWVTDSSGERIALAAVSLLALALMFAVAALGQEKRELSGGTGLELPSPIEPGEPAPAFEVIDSSGDRRHRQDILEGGSAILVFTSATCRPCLGLLAELGRWKEMLSGRLPLHVLASGDETENRRLAEEHGVPLLLDPKGEAIRAFGILGTPGAVEVDSTGRLVTYPVAGAPAIEALIRASLKRPVDGPTLEVRQVAGGSSGRSA